MKRLFLVVVAVLSMTTTFAKDENVNNVENYDMSVNIRRLGEYLGLTIDQMESVSDIHRTFCGEMVNAATANTEDRSKMVHEAVSKDMKYMGYVLTKKQFDKYKMLIDVTLSNRGLEE